MDHDSDLLARVQRLEDLEAIRRTWHDYMISLDSRAWKDLADVFTDDGVVEMIGLDFLFQGGDGTYPGGGEAIVRMAVVTMVWSNAASSMLRASGSRGGTRVRTFMQQ